MKMKKDRMLMITTIVCLLPMILSLVMYKDLPKEVAIHWNEAGVPNNYAPKWVAAFGLPIFMAAINIFTHFMLNNDPKKANAAPVIKLISKWIIPIMTVILVPLTLFISVGHNIPVHIVTPAILGVIVVAFGNYLPKCKQNYTVGIKVPWTLNSEENWNKTHHMAGYLWMIGGICIIMSSLTKLYALFITLGIIGVISIIPIVYSYLLYKKGV